MGYPVQNNAPTTILNGNTLAVGCFGMSSAMGEEFCIGGIYQRQSDGSWNTVSNPIGLYINPGDFVSAVNKVGVNAYVASIFTGINDSLKTLGSNSVILPISMNYSVPGSDNYALSILTTAINSSTWKAASIPAQLVKDYSAYFTPAVPLGSSLLFAGGSVTKIGVELGMYADPTTGQLLGLSSATDLNAIAKSNANIAKAWFDAYGFIPT